jgi:hypothetical protein
MSLGRRIVWFTGGLTGSAFSMKGDEVHRPKRQLASVIRFRPSPCYQFFICTDEKIFRGDSRGFGGIRGTQVNNRVLDRRKRAPWGGIGRMWEYVGGMGSG